MKYLYRYFEKIKKEILNKKIFLFLDFDGTISKIAKTPKEATIIPKAKYLLKKIKDNPKFKLAIISGRSLEDIRKKVAIKGIIYAGNHGLQICGPKLEFNAKINKIFFKILNKIKEGLAEEVKKFKGVFLEEKPFSLSLHYRLLKNKKEEKKLKKIFFKILKPYLKTGEIKIKSAKMALEIMPHFNWDKAKAVLWIINKTKNKKFLPVYIGDDLTDEDAFRVLKNKGITIFVGKPKSTNAQYYLKDNNEVIKFLEDLCNYV